MRIIDKDKIKSIWLPVRENLRWLCGVIYALIRRTPVAILVGLVVFALYLPKPLVQSDASNMVLRYGPALKSLHGVADFAYMKVLPNDSTPWLAPSPATVFSAGVHSRPNAPMGTGWLALPIYYLAHQFGLVLTPENVIPLEGFAASILMALCAALIAGLVRPRWGRRAAWCIAVLFAFCTPAWSMCSRCLWPETGAVFCIIFALYMLYPAPGSALTLFRRLLGYVALWWAFVSMPSCGLAALAVALPWRKQSYTWLRVLSISVLLCGVFALWCHMNMSVLNEPKTWFFFRDIPVVLQQMHPDNYFAALIGLLIAPNRGMLAFALPAFIALIVAIVRFCHRRHFDDFATQWTARMLLVFVLMLLSFAASPYWSQLNSFGSPYVVPLSAIAILSAAPMFAFFIKTPLRASLSMVVVVIALGIQMLGVGREWIIWHTFCESNGSSLAWEMKNPLLRHVATEGRSSAVALPTKEYYLDTKSLSISRWEVTRGKFLAYGFIRLADEVWALPTVSGLWLIPHESLNRGLELQLRVHAKAYPYYPIPIDIYWNGHPIGRMLTISMHEGLDKTPWFRVASKYITPGKINTLEFRVGRAIYQINSPAALGVVFDSVRFLQSPDEELEKKKEVTANALP